MLLKQSKQHLLNLVLVVAKLLSFDLLLLVVHDIAGVVGNRPKEKKVLLLKIFIKEKSTNLYEVETFLSRRMTLRMGSPALEMASFLMSMYVLEWIGRHSALCTTLPSILILWVGSFASGSEMEEMTPIVMALEAFTENLWSFGIT